MKLVIVESPAKCEKIQSFLGAGYKVIATKGHIRALEESLDSVGIDRDWEPHYAEIAIKKDAIAKLRAAAKGCDTIILASDADREGHAIAWHVCHILKLNPLTTPRITFNEITKTAILNAVTHPTTLSMNDVYAQQARAMLDLLVGFTISRVLWNRVAPKLSAGRCQTPALRLVVERDAEVESHTATAFWRLRGQFKAGGVMMLEAQANADLPTQESATAALRAVYANPNAVIDTVKESVSVSGAPKPLITSTLQQEASSLHGLGPKVTMQAAQKLYEAGHITYMRTDNPLLSVEAAMAIRALVAATHGPEYVGPEGQHVIGAIAEKKTKPKAKAAGGAGAVAAPPEAQAAHEAIRPTHPEIAEPDITDPTQKTVYRLIWRRAMQSQMSAAQTDVRKITLRIEADPERVWNTEQTKNIFAGWRILERADAERVAAEAAAWAQGTTFLKAGAALVWTQLHADEQFTKPKGRFTEASLIAELEKRGIGRPSTFATLVTTIIDREYVERTNVEGKTQDSHHLKITPRQWPPAETTQSHKVGAEKNKLRSTPLGRSVSEFLSREYSDLFNYEFTAAMEQSLDEIAKGNKPWKTLLQEIWDTYKERYIAQTSGGSAAAKAARERPLSEDVKIILSRKGPLFVKEPPTKKEKALFASVPPTVSFESATLEDALAAFAAGDESRRGELLGMLEDDEIRKKKGPYGFYAECKGARVPLRGDEDLEKVREKLVAKISFAAEPAATYERKVGDFTIKRGPYGLYFYKHALKRLKFVGLPKTLDPDKATAAELLAAYARGSSGSRGGRGGKK